MKPHPFKTDTWIEGESNAGINLCSEIPIGGVYECTLGKPDLSQLTYTQLFQIRTELSSRTGNTSAKLFADKIPFMGEGELLTKEQVDQYTDDLIRFYGSAIAADRIVQKLIIQIIFA